MRTATVSVFKFDELSDAAKETAREWWRNGLDYPWYDDSIDSIKAFCERFNVFMIDWQIGPYMPSWVTTDAENSHFRGVKLKDIDRDAMPTGYCIDCTLYQTFYDEFKRTGDALNAFKEAIDSAVNEIREDAEYYYTDEAVDDMLVSNEYEFTEDGKVY